MSDKPNLPATKHYVAAEKKERFLQELRDGGMNVTAACKKAGISSTAGIYSERRVDPAFARAWKEIEEALLDHLEELQYKSALERPEDRRWVLARRRPRAWSEKKQTLVNGEVRVGVSVRDMTDEELLAIIAGARTAVDADFTAGESDEAG